MWELHSVAGQFSNRGSTLSPHYRMSASSESGSSVDTVSSFNSLWRRHHRQADLSPLSASHCCVHFNTRAGEAAQLGKTQARGPEFQQQCHVKTLGPGGSCLSSQQSPRGGGDRDFRGLTGRQGSQESLLKKNKTESN